MRDRNENNPASADVARLADEAIDTLAAQFPVCMGSDEFHYFPQARARSFTWSRWDDFSPEGLDEIMGDLCVPF